MDKGSWRAKVYGVAKSQTQLGGFHFHHPRRLASLHTFRGFSLGSGPQTSSSINWEFIRKQVPGPHLRPTKSLPGHQLGGVSEGVTPSPMINHQAGGGVGDKVNKPVKNRQMI